MLHKQTGTISIYPCWSLSDPEVTSARIYANDASWLWKTCRCSEKFTKDDGDINLIRCISTYFILNNSCIEEDRSSAFFLMVLYWKRTALLKFAQKCVHFIILNSLKFQSKYVTLCIQYVQELIKTNFLPKSIPYGIRRFNAAFTKVLQ